MIDTKTLTCSNCHGGDFVRLDDNEFKCTHCNSITIVQDDVAQRLEQLLLRLQAPVSAPVPTGVTRAKPAVAIVAVVAVVSLLVLSLIVSSAFRTRGPDAARYVSRSLPEVDPGLVKIQDLHAAPADGRMIGIVRNDSNRVVSDVLLTMRVTENGVRKNDESASMSERLLPGESLPIEFSSWSPGADDTFDVASKRVGTDDDFAGRANLRLERQQLIRQKDALRFIGRLVNAGAFAAKSISVSVQLLDARGRLVGSGRGSPESRELARGEMTRFDVSIRRYEDAEIASMRYVVDSERVAPGDDR